jgi:hypothetical protein
MVVPVIVIIRCPKYLALPTQIPNSFADGGLSVVPADKKEESPNCRLLLDYNVLKFAYRSSVTAISRLHSAAAVLLSLPLCLIYLPFHKN